MFAAIGPLAHAEHCLIASAIANVSADISAGNIVIPTVSLIIARIVNATLRSLVALRPLQILRLVEIPRCLEPDWLDQPRGNKIGIIEIGSCHNGAGQVRTPQQRASQRRTREVSLDQRGKFEVSARE